MENSQYLKEVRDQYENYPYPRREPEEEKTRILRPFLDSLDLLNYYCFAGKRDFSKDFRVLVAGGGTGDATIYLAEQLRATKAEIVQIDMSAASSKIAEKRAEIRGLKNITFIHDSLLELPKLDIGKFDYINCSGVLHHLKSPEEGLMALKSKLAEDGAIGIMVYGKYGRTPIYFMQELMRMVNKGEEKLQQKVDNAKSVLQHLHPTNWTKRDEGIFKEELAQSGDIGIYDLFLHTQDRAYSVPECYEWVEGAGLKLLTFIDESGIEKLVYSPASYIQDRELLGKILAMPVRAQEAIAELANGRLTRHCLYAAKTARKIPNLADPANVPFFSSFLYSDGMYEEIRKLLEDEKRGSININKWHLSRQITVKKYSRLIFKYLDGERTIREIIAGVKSEIPDADEREIKAEFEEIYNAFNLFDWMLLRHESCPNIAKSDRDLQKIFVDREAV